jgi:tetratricopeptide (TPR) repeat protein
MADPDAMQVYDLALTQRPDDPLLNNNRGAIFQQLGRYQEALVCYEHALAVKPDYPDALNNMGTVLGAFRRYPEALASIRAALQIDPNKVSAHWNLSLCLLRSGQFEEGWDEHEWRWQKAKYANSPTVFRNPVGPVTKAFASAHSAHVPNLSKEPLPPSMNSIYLPKEASPDEQTAATRTIQRQL